MALMLLRIQTRMMPALLALVLFSSGCASNGDPRDPLEPMNRAIYQFNDGVDHLFVKPAAELYQGRLIPEFVRTGLRNFFSNINDVIVVLNDLLQGKFQDAESDLGRIVINSTAGILGFIDVAADAGLVKHNEDFGQTLGVWGFDDGPYLVLPLVGPSSVRDGVGLIVDAYTWPVAYIKPNRTRNQIALLRYIGLRADLLAASRVLEAAALDPYQFLRDAYLQRRRNQVYDGNPPQEDEDPESQSKPRASNYRTAPPLAASLDGFYSLAPDIFVGAPSGALGLKPQESAAGPALIAPIASEPSNGAAMQLPAQKRVVRVWLPAPRQTQ